MMRRITRLIINVFRRSRIDRDLNEEMSSYIEILVASKVRDGLAPEQARREAMIEFGGADQVKEKVRESRAGFMLEEALRGSSRDAVYSVRSLAKSPGWTAVILLTLAIGIGANTIMFTLVNPLALRRLPFKEPDRLVAIMETNPGKGYSYWSASPSDFEQFRGQSKLLEDLSAIRFLGPELLTGTGVAPQDATYGQATANFLPTLGVRPLMGRWFAEREEHIPNAPVAAISFGLWRRAFGGDPNIVGRSVTFDGAEHTIIGVLPRNFRFRWDLDFWTPLPAPESMTGEDPHIRVVTLVGRLKPGIQVSQLQSEVTAIAERLAEQDASNSKGWGAMAAPLQQFYLGQRNIGQRMLLLFSVVGLVLLICCANIANLTLARGASRQKEFAIRTALGASRIRLVRQLITESLMLSVVGGLLGVLLAAWIVPLAESLLPPDMATFTGGPVKVDTQVFAFTLAVSLAAGLLFGLAPAFQFSKTDLNNTLKEGGRNSNGNQTGSRLRKGLVAIEFAVSMIVIIGAGLVFRSFSNLQRTDPGFDPNNVLIIHMPFAPPTFKNEDDISRFYVRLNEQLKRVPGVKSIGITINLPLTGRWPATAVSIEGAPPQTNGERPDVIFSTATPDYFRTLGIKLIAGRFFDERDMAPGAPLVAIISKKAADRFWPGENPIGRRLATEAGIDTPWQTVVGVVSDIHHASLSADADMDIFWPTYRSEWNPRDLIIKTSVEPLSLAPTIQREIQALYPNQPFESPRTMAGVVAGSLAAERLSELLFAILAVLAALLASVGIYGMLSYSVAQRFQEIGIRMALGATTRDVFGMVVRQGLFTATIGIATGVVATIALSRLVSSVLFRVSSMDPFTYLAVTAFMIFVAAMSSYLPARRATRTDPMISLRAE